MGAEASGGGVPGGLTVVVEVLWWSAVGFGVWLLTLSTVTGEDLLVAAGCAVPCGVAARAARSAMAGRWRLHPRWSWWLLPLVAAVVTETLRLWWAALRRRGDLGGELRPVHLPDGTDDWDGREAFASLVLSAPPGTYVVTADPDERTMLEHAVVSGPPEMEAVVTR